MSKKITIPTCMSPFKVTINGEEYIYPAGAEVEVPDEVAHVIECHENTLHKPIEEANSGGASSGGGSPEGGGASSGGDAELNIAYGDTPPEDTSKLWVKTSEPSGVIVSTQKVFSEGGRDASISALAALINFPIESWTSARVGDYIFVFGGETDNRMFAASILRYSISDQAWESLGHLPNNMAKIACAAVGTQIYLIGGGSYDEYYNQVRIFDTQTRILTTTGLTYPGGSICCYIGCAAVGTSIYTFGGANHKSGGPINMIRELNTDTLEWIDRQVSLPKATNGVSCAAIGTKIYIAGGASNEDIYCYDTETHTISTLPCTLPTGYKGNRTMGCGAIGNKIYLFGGWVKPYAIVCIDVEKNEVSKLNLTLPEKCEELTAAVVDDEVYLVAINYRSRNAYKFTAPLGDMLLDEGKIQIIPTTSKNVFSIINDGNQKTEIGVSKVYKGNADGIGEEVEAALHNGTEWVNI